MRLRTLVNRGLIAADAFICSLRRNNNLNNKNVLIAFQQAFGDSVIIQNSLQAYEKVFSKELGYQITMLAQPTVLKFMEANLELPDNIKFEMVDFKKFLSEYSYYRSIKKKYSSYAATLIIPGLSISGEIFSSCSKASRKVGLLNSFDITNPFIMALFYRRACTESVRPEKEDMMLQRHRKLINYLFAKEGLSETFKSELPQLIPKDRIIEEHYAVMCPGASKMEKCWPIERFAQIADFIVEEYGLSIHLCGGSDEEKLAKQMMEKSMHKERIISHIGKTSFSDWSAIVQHAELVLGNDSATMHLAAAGRVPSVCIAGVYDKYQFFPYKVDELGDTDRLPVTILKDMPCEWCRTIGYDAGYGNEECKKRIEAGLCATCIDLITLEEIKMAINGLMKEKNHDE